MNNEFLIVKNMKLFINSLDNIILVIPNRDRVLKDRLYNTSYDVLEILYRCNYSNNSFHSNCSQLTLAFLPFAANSAGSSPL